MPTDKKGDAPLEPTTPVNAPVPEITDDLIKSHPLYQEAKKREAEARKKMDEAAIENKRLKAAIVGEKPEESPEESPQYVTRDALEIVKWEIAHEHEIGLVKEEYQKYLSEGLKPQIALKVALSERGPRPQPPKSSGSPQPNAGVDRSGGDDSIPSDVQDDMRVFGYSKETYLKYKDQVLGKK